MVRATLQLCSGRGDPRSGSRGRRPLHRPGRHLQRRDGHGPSRARRRDRALRRRQAPARPDARLALRDRGAAAGPARPPARRARRRPLPRRRRLLHRHGADRGREPARPAHGRGHARAAGRRGHRVGRAGVRGAGLHPPAARRPPRRQAAEPHPGRPRRRARRLRRRARAGRVEPRDDRRRHAALHGARGLQRRPRLRALGRLQPRGHAGDADRGHAAVLHRPRAARRPLRRRVARRSTPRCARAWSSCPSGASRARRRSPRRWGGR